MAIPRKLQNPTVKVVQNDDIKLLNFSEQAHIHCAVGKLTTAWAYLEFSLTNLLAIHSQMPIQNGYLMFGRMSSMAKYDKIISLLKLNNKSKSNVEFFKDKRRDTRIPCEIRNIISHSAILGVNKNDENLIYYAGQTPAVSGREAEYYLLHLDDITAVANFAYGLSGLFGTIAIDSK